MICQVSRLGKGKSEGGGGGGGVEGEVAIIISLHHMHIDVGTKEYSVISMLKISITKCLFQRKTQLFIF